MLSYAVSQQAREIGIRMALGASARLVQWRVVKKTLTLAGLGIFLGWMGSLHDDARHRVASLRRRASGSSNVCADGARAAGHLGARRLPTVAARFPDRARVGSSPGLVQTREDFGEANPPIGWQIMTRAELGVDGG